MPNGMEMTEEEFNRRNVPLTRIDALWVQFAKKVGGRIIYNYHNRPDRRITLPGQVGRGIALQSVWAARDALGRPLGPLYFLTIGANYCTDRDITNWSDDIAKLPPDQVNPETLEPLLERAWERLKDIDIEYLRAHGTVTKFPPGRAVYPKDQYVEHPSVDPNDLLQN